jgi:hypothetical protein
MNNCVPARQSPHEQLCSSARRSPYRLKKLLARRSPYSVVLRNIYIHFRQSIRGNWITSSWANHSRTSIRSVSSFVLRSSSAWFFLFCGLFELTTWEFRCTTKYYYCVRTFKYPLLVLVIDTPHPVHTHSRSSLYIYKVFQHLLQWLQVIRM